MSSCILQLEDVGETIEKLRVGHDNSGFGAAWHLNRVEVRRLLENTKVQLDVPTKCSQSSGYHLAPYSAPSVLVATNPGLKF